LITCTPLPGAHPKFTIVRIFFYTTLCLQDGVQGEELEDEVEPRTAAAAAAVGPALPAVDPPTEGMWQLVREKRFAMPPITVDEAIVCLNYVDHNFYVRRPSLSPIGTLPPHMPQALRR
jgi:hypothetical protein